jgi:acyl carrier protein
MSAWFRKADTQSTSTYPPLDAERAAQKLREFIAAKSKLVKASEIGNETKLFSSGLLDSLAFIELVLYVEKQFHVKLADVTEISLTSLDSIEQFLNPIFKHLGKTEPASSKHERSST